MHRTRRTDEYGLILCTEDPPMRGRKFAQDEPYTKRYELAGKGSGRPCLLLLVRFLGGFDAVQNLFMEELSYVRDWYAK